MPKQTRPAAKAVAKTTKKTALKRSKSAAPGRGDAPLARAKALGLSFTPVRPNLSGPADAIALALTSTVTANGNSAMAEWLRCPFASALKAQGVYAKASPDWSQIGVLVHAGLALEGFAELTGLDVQWQDLFNARGLLSGKYTLENIAEANRLLRAYEHEYDMEQCAGFGPGRKLLAVEHFMSADLNGPYTARVDTLLANSGPAAELSQLTVVDTKTRASMYRIPDDELGAKLRTRPQFLGIAYLVQQAFGVIPSIMVNFISKAAVPSFRRIEFLPSAAEIEAWAENHRALQAVRGTRSLPVYKNYNECAPDIGTPCWAFDWCHGDEQAREEKFVCPSAKRKR